MSSVTLEKRLEKIESDIAEIFSRLEKTRNYINALRVVLLEQVHADKHDLPED